MVRKDGEDEIKPIEIPYQTVLQRLESMTLRRMAEELAPRYGFPWKWDRSRYTDNYLVQQFSEKQVQDAIIAELEFWRVDVVHVDAGMSRARGRMIAAGKAQGMNVMELVKFRGGGIPAGWPDLHATLAPEGRDLFIEVKAPAWIDPQKPQNIISEAGKPTIEQLAFLDSKHNRGAICLVAWSVEDVTRCLGDRLDKNREALDRSV